jgi:hypothetical protein
MGKRTHEIIEYARRHATGILLFVPFVWFTVSLCIRPVINWDSGLGFLALRNMLEGGRFNYVAEPDPTNIADTIAAFQTWYSPGQYLAPGIFVWLGADYGVAISLTVLIATLVGVIGWAQVARSFGVSSFVLLLFVIGLVSFRYSTHVFQDYQGGEPLLFAVAPWSLYVLRWAADKPPRICFPVSLLVAAVLFFAKLSGLVVFAATVLAISLLNGLSRRRLTSSMVAIWGASATAALLFLAFWKSRGYVPADAGLPLALTWQAIWFPLAGAAFSGFSGLDLSSWLFQPNLFKLAVTSYVAGPIGLLLMIWAWVRLRNTPYRDMAVLLFVVIAFYAAFFAAMYIKQANIGYTERYFRYVGVLFLLMLLVAADRWRVSAAKGIAILLVGVFSFGGVASFAADARDLMRGHYYDPVSGTSQTIVPPAVLEYLRSATTEYKWQGPIAVLPSPVAAVALPGFRFIVVHPDFLRGRTWAGKADRIFVIAQERMVEDGRADALLRSFFSYDINSWERVRMESTVVFYQ